MANGASKGNLILIACAVATLVLDARRDKREEAERRQEYVAVVEVPQDASGEREDGLVDFRNEPILGSEREDAHVDFTKRPYYGGGRVSDMLLPDPEGHPDESFDFRKVHPGLVWVEVEAAAVEVDGCFEVVGVSIAADAAFDGHDFAVHPLGNRVGDAVSAEADDDTQAIRRRAC